MSATPRARPSRFRPSRVLQHRHDQALAVRELDREAEVDVVARDDLVAADLAVDPGVLAQRLDGGAGDEGEVGRVDAVGLLVLLLQLAPDRDHLRHVDLDRARDVRGRVERAAHVLGDPLAHRRHRLDRLAGLRLGARGGSRGCGGCGAAARCGGLRRAPEPPAAEPPARRALRRARPGRRGGGACSTRGCRLLDGRRRGRRCGLAAALDEREDVLLRHAAAGAGALDRVRIDAVLGGDPGDDGRDEGAAVAGLRRCGRGGSGWRSGSGGCTAGCAVSVAAASEASAAAWVAGSGGAAGASAGAAPSGAITASTVPTSTVSPSWTRICATTPSPGLGTSVSTLSVEISSSGSSRPIVLALRLEPLRDRPLGDGHAHLGHDDFGLRSGRHLLS